PGRPVRRQLRESRRKQFVPPAAKQVDLERVVSDEDPGLGRSLSEANGVELRRVALRIDDRQQRARTGLSCAGALRRVGIAVGHNDERNFEVAHKPHVWSEVRAAYSADRDPQRVERVPRMAREYRDQKLLRVTFDEHHAAREQELAPRDVEVALEVPELWRIERELRRRSRS